MVHRDPPEKHADKAKEPPLKHVKMQKGTDEVNHGTTSYPVPKDGHVDLPPVVADHVIRQGGAEDLTPKPADSTELIDVKHISDPNAFLSYADVTYTANNQGVLSVPIVSDYPAHGFLPVVT